MRYFNTTGPVNCQKHYCLPPLERFDLDEIIHLIQQEKYFVLHAPRQTGKTSYLLALMDYLNQTGEYHCLYINVESAQAAREDFGKAMTIIFDQLVSNSLIFLQDSFLSDHKSQLLENAPGSLFNIALTQWSQASSKPIVLLIDEIDTLIGDTLISILRQLRSSYPTRPQFFPSSVILCGVRDVRDYRMHSDDGKPLVTGGSAFNIKAASLRMSNFTQAQVETLYQQHTAETGQIFEERALHWVWDLTRGQPWLVNALAHEVTFQIKANRDRSRPIMAAQIEQAKENIIMRRETHLDQLVDKLKEERVRQVIEPLLTGDTTLSAIPNDHILYVRDLGLIEIKGQIRIANRIYREVIPRELTFNTQVRIAHETTWYVQADGRLDVPKLLAAFQQFFREHSEHWVERFDYKEAGPQLLLQSFLQRIVNPSTNSGRCSGGRVEREYGLGRKRTDLLVLWPYAAPDGEKVQRAVIELKILYKTLEKTLAEGLQQTWEYMDKCGAAEAHLIIFDRREKRTWDEKIFRREETFKGHPITVWGM